MEVIESGLNHEVLLDRNQEGVLCLTQSETRSRQVGGPPGAI